MSASPIILLIVFSVSLCSECTGGKLECTPRLKHAQPPSNVEPICPNGKEYVKCKSKCTATCQDPSGEPGCENSLAGCKAGCECPKGLSLY